MNCIDCNIEFKPFVHNQRRCRSCVANANAKNGSHVKNKQRLFHKHCKWCSNLYEMTGPASLYCSDSCAFDSKKLQHLQKSMVISKEVFLRDKDITLCQSCMGESFQLSGHKVVADKLCFDHCHKTGKYRGRLCHNCNRGAGLMGDTLEGVMKLVKYLEGAETIPEGSTPKRVEAHDTEK